jgi:elongation factor 3
MRQLKEGKVENFPSQDQLRCVMVEHALQGENTSLSILDFIASGESDSYLIPHEEIDGMT